MSTNDVTVNDEVFEESTELMVDDNSNADYDKGSNYAKIAIGFISGAAIVAAIEATRSWYWKKRINRVLKKAEQYKEECDDEVQ